MAFGAETTTDEVLAGVDLSGRLALVTGASTGLGLETARALASAGAAMVVTGRSAEKARTAAEAVGERVPGADVEPGTLELASLTRVREFAKWFVEHHDRLDVLINNAGVMATPFERTADGFELQFGTNHLGHFLLTCLLAPVLVAGAPSRVVNLSSRGHQRSDIGWDDVNYERRPYDKFEAYGQSKTANVLFTVELDRRLAPRGVRAYAVHPGMVFTELGRHMTRDDLETLVSRAGGDLPAPKPIPAGAATTVWAATAPELADRGGAYLEDCHVSDAHAPWARDPESAARLWTLSEDLAGEHFPLTP